MGALALPDTTTVGWHHQTGIRNGLLVAVLQVPLLVLTACCELLKTHQPAAITPAQFTAALLLNRATADMPPLPDNTGSSSRSSSSSSSSSSSRGLTVAFWEQLEQSGFLQQLPDTVGHQASRIHASKDRGNDAAARLAVSQDARDLLEALHGLRTLQPSFLTAHAAGQRCVVPAMQLGLHSMQYISTAVEKAGREQHLRTGLALLGLQ